MVFKRFGWFAAAALSLFALGTTAFAAGPMSPYKALGLPNVVHPTLQIAPVQIIMIGSFSVQLEVTHLDAVKKQFGGVVRGAGDAGNAVTWLCYAGKNEQQMPVVYWFASTDEMSGNHHEVTQVAAQANPSGIAPLGCGEAPAALSGIDFGVPSVGATVDAVSRHFGAGKPDARGYVGYASSTPVQGEGKGDEDARVTQSVQYRVRDSVVTVVSVSQVTAD
jgi:hypothetical protein